MTPATPPTVSLLLPPWIVSPAPVQIESLPALPPSTDWLPPVALIKTLAPLLPKIVSPATPAIVSLPPLPPRTVSVAAPQIVSFPAVPPVID